MPTAMTSGLRQQVDVFVVAGVRLYEEGLGHVLEGHADLRLVGSARDLATALERLRALETGVNVVLVDPHTHDGLPGVRELRDELPDVRVVVLAIDDRPVDVLRWAEAGVTGYVTRDASADELVEIVRAVARGEMRCSPQTTASLIRHVGDLARRARPGRSHAPLTQRERDVVRLIGQGLSNKEIAQRLCIELPTVKNHVHHLLEKLQVERRADAAAVVRGELVD